MKKEIHLPYQRVIIKVNGKLKTLTAEQFDKFWKKVGVQEGTKAFQYRSYNEKLLDPHQTDCPHLETDIVETFGHESNIIQCVKCHIFFRENSGEFGVTWQHNWYEKEKSLLYKGKRFAQWQALQGNVINV